MMANAGTRALAAALLFSFSAVVFFLLLLQAPGLADIVASALDRFLTGRGLLELATRRNMILLCHAILLLILRDAGVLGAPARRRSRSPQGEATAATSVVSQTAGAATVARRLVECQPAAEAAAAAWAAPVLTTEEAAAVATKQIVLVESPTNGDDDLIDRAAIVEQLEHRHIVVAADDEEKRMDDQTAGMEMELADDRTFEEFIQSQRRKMQQESQQLQLVSSGYQYQAIATTCY